MLQHFWTTVCWYLLKVKTLTCFNNGNCSSENLSNSYAFANVRVCCKETHSNLVSTIWEWLDKSREDTWRSLHVDMVRGGGGGWTGTDIRALPCIKQRQWDLLHRARGSAWCPVVTWRGGIGECVWEGGVRGRGYMYIYSLFTSLCSGS